MTSDDLLKSSCVNIMTAERPLNFFIIHTSFRVLIDVTTFFLQNVFRGVLFSGIFYEFVVPHFPQLSHNAPFKRLNFTYKNITIYVFYSEKRRESIATICKSFFVIDRDAPIAPSQIQKFRYVPVHLAALLVSLIVGSPVYLYATEQITQVVFFVWRIEGEERDSQ